MFESFVDSYFVNIQCSISGYKCYWLINPSNVIFANPRLKTNYDILLLFHIRTLFIMPNNRLFMSKWHMLFMESCRVAYFTPLTTRLLGVYWFHSVRLTVCLSVSMYVRTSIRPSHIRCPLCSAYSFGWIHFIFIHLIKLQQMVYRM